MINSQHSTTHPIFIVAGEVSGDMFAAELMSKLQEKGNYHFVGCGGPKMRQEGLQAISQDNSLWSSIGLLEAWRYVIKHWILLNRIVPAIKKYDCKHIILVDHEFFNIMVAKKIRQALGESVKIYFFIPPRVSMWGKKLAPIVGKLCDALFCYMQPDVPLYLPHNPNSFFYGNPLSHKLKTFIPSYDFIEKHNLKKNKVYIALLPGSRQQEIRQLLPIYLETARRLNIEKDIDFLLTVAHPDLQSFITKEIANFGLQHCVHIIDDSSLEILAHCSVGLICAGTATLEAVMMETYPVITYKVSNFTFNSMKKSEGLDDSTLVGLPNVFLQQRIFPEILQFEVTAQRLYQEITHYLNMSPEMRHYIMADAKERLNDAIGHTDSITKIAEYISEDINN